MIPAPHFNDKIGRSINDDEEELCTHSISKESLDGFRKISDGGKNMMKLFTLMECYFL